MSSDTTIRGRIEFLVPATQGGEHLITLEFETAAELKGIVQYAQKQSWRPRFFGPSVANGAPSQTSTNGLPSGPPLCPLHKKPMKPSTQGEGWFCPRKVEQGWCKYRSPDGTTITQVE